MRFFSFLLLGMLAFVLTELNEARAAPAFQAAGTAASGTGTVSPAWPAHAVDDIALLFVESAGGEAATLSTAAGFAAVLNSPQFSGAGTAGTRLTVFWARATSAAMATPQVADPGNHVYARILTYRGVIATGDPWDVTGGGVKAVASTSVTVTGVTTTVSDTLIVQAVARDNDSAAAAFSAQTNGSLTGIAERSDDGTNSGNGGGIGIWDGVKATAGATGDTTATVTSSINAFLTIALRPGSIVLGDGTDPGGAAIGPGGAATMADAFTFATASGTNQVSAVVVGLAAGTSGGLSLVEITNDAGSTVYGSVANPATDTPSITLSTNTLSATTTSTQYKIRVTPRSHANMPAPPGSAYSVTAKINSWTSTYRQSGSDTAGTTATIDNLSPANVTASSCTAGTEQVTLGWTNPADSDFNSVVALRGTAAVSDTPVEGTVYSVGNTIGSSTVACATGASPCTDSGLTGGTAYHYRLFARDSNGNYSSTGVVPSGSPCTPASPPAARFNACDVGTTCTNATPSTFVKTKLAGVAVNLDLVALNTDGSRNTSYNNTVSVELLNSSDNSGALDSDQCRSTWSTIVTLSPNPSFAPADKGLITVGPFTVANAYRDVRVRVTNVGGPSRRGCSTDNFAIRPNTLANLSVTDDDWQTAGTTRTLNETVFTAGTLVHKAGRPFTVRADALNAAGVPVVTTNYTGSPTPTLSACAGAACTATFGTFTLGASFAAGQLTSNAATYDEVGSFNLQLVDSAFASVDSGDGTPTDCTASGRYVCSGTLAVGRFVPDHFAVSLNTPDFGAACAAGSFTYVGQAFSYNTLQPIITVTAQNFANSTTTLYAGAWSRITNSTVTPATQAARYSRFDALGGGTTPALDTAGLPATAGDPAIGVFAAGVGTLTFSSGTGLAFTRSTSTPNAPFNADIALALNVIDTDSVAFAGNPAAFGTATAGGGIAFTGGKDMRFGRLRMQNALGSEKLDLPIPLQAQYWTGTEFATNSADSCTSLSAANLSFSTYTGGITAGNMNAANISLGGAFASGVGSLKLTKPLPAPASPGSTTLTANLTAEAKSYLQGNWGVPTYTANPSARAAFGLFGAQPRNFIFFRENY